MVSISITVWKDILDHFRSLRPELVRAWFNHLKPISMDAGVLIVEADNHAQLSYLQQHCQRFFARAVQASTGRLLCVQFNANNDHPRTSLNFRPQHEKSNYNFNEECVFENFVTGPCNRLAHAAAQAIPKTPGETYNPFFIHGDAGLGKTHLLQAICQETIKLHQNFNCLYLPCEKFISRYIAAVASGELHRFRRDLCHLDMLAIDDIHFLAKRERSQEEFFHVFNTLHQSQRQIILTANCSPSKIANLETRLISRFNACFVARLDVPCPETCMAIIRKKAQLRCIEIPEEAIELLASKVANNPRTLEETLVTIDTLSQSKGSGISIGLVRQAIGMRLNKPISIPAVIEAVTRRYDVNPSQLCSKKQSRIMVLPRQICMYLARRLTSHSLVEIGQYFGGRNHATVLYAVRTVTEQVDKRQDMKKLIIELETKLGSRNECEW